MASEVKLPTPKRTDRDDFIIRRVVEWTLLNRSELRRLFTYHGLDVPSRVVLDRRLQALGFGTLKLKGVSYRGLGFLRSVEPPEDKWGESILYPSQRAYDLALAEKWISHEIRAKEIIKSNIHLVHHRMVVASAFAHLEAFRTRYVFSFAPYNREYGYAEDKKTWFADLMQYVEVNGRYPVFFDEWEHIREHSTDPKFKKVPGKREKSVSERMKKAIAFAKFFVSGEFAERFRYPDAHMRFIVTTDRQALNCAKALRYIGQHAKEYALHADVAKALASDLFWVTDADSILRDPRGRIYITPRDFESRRYSLEEA